jgi:hypothetical protein
MKRLIPLALIIATTATFAKDLQPEDAGAQFVAMRINDHGQLVTAPSTKTRKEVAAERLLPQVSAMRIDDHGQLVTPPSTKSRAEVQAELAEAVRTGDTLAVGESGATLKELHPQWFAKSGGVAVVRHSDAVSGTAQR